ncbi:serine/threonine-protein kinase [Streptomyces sp. TRM68367]|uniref:serine/threonine-protein kinase n=1 Tax=Streptomyces sp. TRM68367 TaxID=2758415 RepID=UPI00165A70FE|nr:serine/threonine-protein kinase [Streptomyces sp. TRM68367]MBC9731139.1 protein kinase [Streptomyces sp. TRM68367]
MLVAGRYRLVEQVGRGGMGAVWRAEDTLLGREVAVKLLTARPEADTQELRHRYERVRREARSAAMINHRNVVMVHDVVEDSQGLPCIVMELVQGRSLAQRVAEDGPLTAPEVASIGREVLAALRAAHEVGVLHRDVKPGNVLLAADGRVVLTDFGIAVWAGAASLTRSGELTGSAGYIAPERLRAGGAPGPASDLWALGATLYYAVEGHGPFERPTALEEAYATVAEEPHPMRGAGALAPILEGLLAKIPQARRTAEQAEQLLRSVAEDTPSKPGPADPPTALTESAKRALAERASDPNAGRTRRARRPRIRPQAAVTAIGASLATVAALAWGANGYAQQDVTPRVTARHSANTSLSCGAAPSATLPARYRWVHYLGGTVAVPTAWRSKERSDGQQVDFIDPTNRVLLRIGRTDLAGTDPVAGWTSLEKMLSKNFKDYRRLRLEKTCQQGRPAAVWEFTWQASVRYRAIDLGWSDARQNGYGIYLSAPAVQWQTYQPVFDTAVATIHTS